MTNFEPGIPIARTPQETIKMALELRRSALRLRRPVNDDVLVLTSGEAEDLCRLLENEATFDGEPRQTWEELLEVIRRGEARLFEVPLRIE